MKGKGAARWTLTCSCLLLLGLLTGCDAAQWPLGNQSRPVTRHPGMAPPADRSAARKSAAAATSKPTPRNQSRPETASTATAADVTPVSTAMPSALDGGGNPALIGLNSEQAKVVLGPPTEELERAPAKIWRYRTPQCTLDVALYPDVQTHDFRVLNYEVNGNDGTEQGRRQCIAGLRSGLRTR